MSDSTVLVTGGSGFLGREIVNVFLAHHWHVRSITRHDSPDLQRLGVECFRGDISVDESVVMKATENCRAVIHCAAKAGVWGSRDEFLRANVYATKNMIKCCIKNNVSSFVLTSSPSVVFSGADVSGGNESIPYPAKFHSYYCETKALAEQFVLSQHELNTCALRPHLIWGPGEPHMLPRIWANANKLVIVGDGKNMVDCVYVTNAAEAHYLATIEMLSTHARCKGKAYFITNDEPVYLWEFINKVLLLKNKRPITRHTPRQMAIIAGLFCENLYKLLGCQKEPFITSFVARELSSSHWFDCSAAKRDFGYVPRVSMEEGLRILANAQKLD